MTIPSLNTYGGRLRDLGYAGDIASQNPVATRTLTNEAATLIQFGTAVASGAADDTCKAPTADGDKIIGIAMRQPTHAADGTTRITAFVQYDSVAIMTMGDVWGQPVEGVTKGDQVLSITAQNGALGGTTGGAAGAGRVVVPGAFWENTVASGQVGKVHIVVITA